MTAQELHDAVTERIPGPDWFVWRGEIFEEDCNFASDRIMFVKEETADPSNFELAKQLEGSNSGEKFDQEEAERSWNTIASNFAVDELEPVAIFDLTEEEDLTFLFFVLFKNEPRDEYILVDGQRYRLFLSLLNEEVKWVYGKGQSDPIFAVSENEHNEEVIGMISPVTDQSGKYLKRFREMRPDLGL